MADSTVKKLLKILTKYNDMQDKIRNFFMKQSWTNPIWIFPKLIYCVLCAFGAVIFATNILSGIIIFLGIAIWKPLTAASGVFTTSIAVIFSTILGANQYDVCSGFTAFNSVLLGVVSVDTIPALLKIELNAMVWLSLAISAIFTTMLDIVLINALKGAKLSQLLISFNISALILFMVLRTCTFGDCSLVELSTFSNSTLKSVQEISMEYILQGTLMTFGQVYGTFSLHASILICLGYFVYSPIATPIVFLSTFIASYIGVTILPPPYTASFQGVIGINAFLTSCALSHFTVQNPFGILMTILGGTSSTLLQVVATPLLEMVVIPNYSWPFNIITITILAVVKRVHSLYLFVENRRTPELHLLDHISNKVKSKEDISMDVDGSPKDAAQKVQKEDGTNEAM